MLLRGRDAGMVFVKYGEIIGRREIHHFRYRARGKSAFQQLGGASDAKLIKITFGADAGVGLKQQLDEADADVVLPCNILKREVFTDVFGHK